jgi:hypothetical protein
MVLFVLLLVLSLYSLPRGGRVEEAAEPEA